MKSILKLTVYGELTDLNTYINAERRNRFLGAKVKREETLRVQQECMVQKIKPIEKGSSAVFVWYHKDARKDFDNVEFAQKFIWDGMVSAGVLPGDGQKNVPIERLHVHFTDKENPRVELEIFDSAIQHKKQIAS